MINEFGNIISQNIFFGIIIALLAGIISTFTPCALSSIPLIIGYVGGYNENDKKKPFIYSVIFSLGRAITYTILGVITATIGGLFIGKWWYIVLGVIMLVVGLQIIGVIKIGSNVCRIPKQFKGKTGAFILGIVGGVFSSPCSTPILIAILAFVAEKGNILQGAMLLFVYSIGHSIIIIIAGTSVGLTQVLLNSDKTSKISNVLKYIFSTLIILLGLYMLYLGF